MEAYTKTGLTRVLQVLSFVDLELVLMSPGELEITLKFHETANIWGKYMRVLPLKGIHPSGPHRTKNYLSESPGNRTIQFCTQCSLQVDNNRELIIGVKFKFRRLCIL